MKALTERQAFHLAQAIEEYRARANDMDEAAKLPHIQGTYKKTLFEDSAEGYRHKADVLESILK